MPECLLKPRGSNGNVDACFATQRSSEASTNAAEHSTIAHCYRAAQATTATHLMLRSATEQRVPLIREKHESNLREAATEGFFRGCADKQSKVSLYLCAENEAA